MTDQPTPTTRHARLYDPRPAMIVGTVGWMVALIIIGFTEGTSSSAFAVCVAGIVVGALGYGLFRLQRAAARRGSRGAQQGLT